MNLSDDPEVLRLMTALSEVGAALRVRVEQLGAGVSSAEWEALLLRALRPRPPEGVIDLSARRARR